VHGSALRRWQGVGFGVGFLGAGVVALLAVIGFAGCGREAGEGGYVAGKPKQVSKTAAAKSGNAKSIAGRTKLPGFEVTSTAFDAGGTIPKVHTADGDDFSPPLRWQGAPAGTKSFVLICDDPDAPRGTWVHWVVYDIDPTVSALGAGITGTPTIGGAAQGRNDFGNLGYGGPSPPKGPAHRYFFRLLALDKRLGLESGATRREVLAAADGHVLALGELMGRYGR
jgi:Raf kinase inhibitor-like YbhB/YbcL family protein